jgi:hypothetical protein
VNPLFATRTNACLPHLHKCMSHPSIQFTRLGSNWVCRRFFIYTHIVMKTTLTSRKVDASVTNQFPSDTITHHGSRILTCEFLEDPRLSVSQRHSIVSLRVTFSGTFTHVVVRKTDLSPYETTSSVGTEKQEVLGLFIIKQTRIILRYFENGHKLFRGLFLSFVRFVAVGVVLLNIQVF